MIAIKYCVSIIFGTSITSFPTQLRRQARLRREYIYRKTIEERERAIQEKKQKLADAIEGGSENKCDKSHLKCVVMQCIFFII